MNNTITIADIDNLIFNASINYKTVCNKCTLMTVQLENGFVINVDSSCVDPSNYNEVMGFQNCLKKVREKLWELEGYKLQCELFSRK